MQKLNSTCQFNALGQKTIIAYRLETENWSSEKVTLIPRAPAMQECCEPALMQADSVFAVIQNTRSKQIYGALRGRYLLCNCDIPPTLTLQSRMLHSHRTKYTLSIVQYPWQHEYIRMFVDWHGHVAILLLFNETSDFLAEGVATNSERLYAADRIIRTEILILH